ncbi:MAG: alkaline phosphatase [Planctomycetota bacterium]|jgi:alkaline phosphatase|uniref:alkaline phosphatase n=1 Tax=Patiriisocius sp. Uisw_047 TaxID=3230969 RepID=UPI0039ED101D
MSIRIKDILIGCFLAFSTISYAQKNGEQPKNIILLIGDGMGLSEITAAQFYSENTSNFEEFNTIGLIKTSSSQELITDSAAAATAFACGEKTYNGAIGVDDNREPLKNIVDFVSNNGMATGLVSTSSIVHATPASFFAHVDSRRKYTEIATYLPSSEIDFVAGGGLQFFERREDGKDLVKTLKEKGFDVITDKLPKSTTSKKQAILLADDEMPKMLDGRGDFLPDATALALKHLSKNKKGFFLMVEGSQIDWGGHANDAEYLVSELLDFDKTVGVALAFAKKNKNTLVIVTADHETGGFTLAADGTDYNKIKMIFSTGGHSATMIPVFAKGPGAQKFAGIYENTEIYTKMVSSLIKKKN